MLDGENKVRFKMTREQLERRKDGIIREMQRLLIDLEELEDDVAVEERERSDQSSILDFYVPGGLRHIHRLPMPRL